MKFYALPITMLCLLLASFVAAEDAASRQPIPLLSPQRLVEKIQNDEKVVFLDVREPDEFAENHIPGAINIPQRDFESRVTEIPQDALVIPYCNMDFRGFVAVRELEALGVSKLALMQERGIQGWQRAGLPIVGGDAGLTEQEALGRLQRQSPEELLGDRVTQRVPATGRVHRVKMEVSEWYFEPNDLEIQAGDELRISLTSAKGSHFFILPDFEIQQAIQHGQTEEIRFIADREGTFKFGSCEWDGGALQMMKGRLRVTAQDN